MVGSDLVPIEFADLSLKQFMHGLHKGVFFKADGAMNS